MADTISEGYASELRREILRSEIQRVRVLAIILGCLLVVTLSAVNLMPGLVHRKLLLRTKSGPGIGYHAGAGSFGKLARRVSRV